MAHRNTARLGLALDGRGLELLAASGRARRLAIGRYDLVTSLD
jgi:hypothetical protein